MKRLCLFLLVMLGFGVAHAQNEDEQLLIFRSTGEVNLLYSSEVDSIVCSCMDKDSLLHDDFVSQIFYAKDTVMVVPIAEIDSVAFGQRNVTKYKKDVRQLTVRDLSYIIRYDGEAIYYRTDTPSDILPVIGQKLFYGEMDDIFPIGLCAKVTAIEKKATEIKVSVSDVGLEEVFDELFFAGRVQPEAVTVSRTVNGARTTHTLEIPCKINLNDWGSIKVSGRVNVNADFIVQPLKHYYHANITMDTDVGFDVNLTIDKAEYSYEDEITTFHFPNIAAVLHPQITVGAFAELNAELSFNYSMRRNYHQAWEWTRIDGVNTFANIAANDAEPPEDKAQMDVTCNGNLYFGPQFVFEFNTLLSAAGVRLKAKVGPEVESDVGLGLIQSLGKEYNPELYAKGEINFTNKLGISGHAFTRDFLTGKEKDYTIFVASNKWGRRTYNLFPNFVGTKAVEMQRQDETVTISTATVSSEEIVRDVEAGFQLEIDSTQTILSKIFVEKIAAKNTTRQGISSEFVLPETTYDPKKIVARPIFEYAGCTILADKAKILTDNHIQPLVALMTDGVNTVLSGYPMIGSTVIDSTYYNVGSYMPVPVKDVAFASVTSNPLVIGIYISPQEEITLIGTWNGEVDGKETTITFKEDATGSYEQGRKENFTYKMNYPQSGDIVLYMEDSTSKVYAFYSLTEKELVLKPKKQNKYYTFTKK